MVAMVVVLTKRAEKNPSPFFLHHEHRTNPPPTCRPPTHANGPRLSVSAVAYGCAVGTDMATDI